MSTQKATELPSLISYSEYVTICIESFSLRNLETILYIGPKEKIHNKIGCKTGKAN